jgi:hypothetical protein
VDAPDLGPNSIVVVPRALVPMVIWRSVPVTRMTEEALTPLERFMIEAALTLGVVRPVDIEQISSLPPAAVTAATWRLLVAGILRRDGDDLYPIPALADSALSRAAVGRPRAGRADFLFLPRTQDVVVLSATNGGRLSRDLDQRQVAPVATAPVPTELWGERLGPYLDQRIRERTLSGAADDIRSTRFDDESPYLFPPAAQPDGDTTDDTERPRTCPAYNCAAVVTQERPGDYTVTLTISGSSARRAKRGAEEDRIVEVTARITGVGGLCASWLALAEAAIEPGGPADAWRALYAKPAENGAAWYRSSARGGATTLDFTVNAEAAFVLAADGGMLISRAGLAVESDEATVELSCGLRPGDAEAARLFAIDAAVVELLRSDQPLDDLDRILAGANVVDGPTGRGIDAGDLRDRAWRLGHYPLVYALRARSDFCYA